MNQQIKQLWVNALRSGEYKQATGRLRKNDGYCCLGVLCDLHSKTTGEGHWEGEGEGDQAYSTTIEDDKSNIIPGVRMIKGIFVPSPLETISKTPVGAIVDVKPPSVTCLPKFVEKWADFYGYTHLGPEHLDLAYYNDERKLSFNEIADLIEKEA